MTGFRTGQGRLRFWKAAFIRIITTISCAAMQCLTQERATYEVSLWTQPSASTRSGRRHCEGVWRRSLHAPRRAILEWGSLQKHSEASTGRLVWKRPGSRKREQHRIPGILWGAWLLYRDGDGNRENLRLSPHHLRAEPTLRPTQVSDCGAECGNPWRDAHAASSD